MPDTVVRWASPTAWAEDVSLADVIVCTRDGEGRAAELCDWMLRTHPGAAVVLLAPVDVSESFTCFSWPDALHVAACSAHDWFSLGVEPPARQDLWLWCQGHRSRAAPCGRLCLVSIARQGVRQGLEAVPDRGGSG